MATTDEYAQDRANLDLQAKARAVLTTLPSLDGFNSECHAVMLRAHLEYTSYTLFSPQGDGDGIVLVRNWRRHGDWNRAGRELENGRNPHDLEPTFDESQVELPLERLETLLRAAAGLAVPVRLPTPVTGVDGTEYFLSFSDFDFASACFHWWQKSWMNSEGSTIVGPPQPGWEGLASLFRSIVELTRSE